MGLLYVYLYHKMFVVIVKFVVAVQNWFVRCGCFSVIDFCNGSYREGVKLYFGSQHGTLRVYLAKFRVLELETVTEY
jgi:hypothetical protein